MNHPSPLEHFHTWQQINLEERLSLAISTGGFLYLVDLFLKKILRDHFHRNISYLMVPSVTYLRIASKLLWRETISELYLQKDSST
jgi:hypothetical protein